MFNNKDMQQIDRKYFMVKETSCYNIHLQSRNTRHHWTIQPVTNNGHRSLVVLHKHKDVGEFHIQPFFHPCDVSEAQRLTNTHGQARGVV